MNFEPDRPVELGNYILGETTVHYFRAPNGVVEWQMFPTALTGRLAALPEHEHGPHIDGLPARWKPQPARQHEWLVQWKLAGSPEPGGHQVGRSLRGADDVHALTLAAHTVHQLPLGGKEIITTLRHPCGAELQHVLKWSAGDAFIRTHTVVENRGSHPITLEYLTSFSLGGITPFQTDEAAEKLSLHRFRSTWSAEGRHEAAVLEDLSLDRSWIGYNRRTLRFGQLGSLPVREFFPFLAVEDTESNVLWGAQLQALGSWHLEISRLKDKVVLSGGLPSRDFGEWWKTVAPGESFATPPATLACVQGDIDDLCAALNSAQIAAANQQPASERELPTVFNEWCSSWGDPTHDYVIATARKLTQTRTKYLVIDDGWAEKPAGQDIQFNGDWVVDRKKFPGGLRATCDAVRALGLIPGLWFEMEAATRGTRAYELTDHHLKLKGRVIQVGNRHFWDFRDRFTQEYLTERVLVRLRDDGFGYLKVDYNDTLPAGVDGDESPGEALREHLVGVQSFFTSLRRELPELVIENCSSGGHRLEPSFMALCAQGSFSDAHETFSIPIIAANLHRLILPRQSQIWAVLHPSDSGQYFRYKLAATFLGRMCLSGEVRDLSEEQMAEIVAAQDFYATAVPIIRDGSSRLVRKMGRSWNQPCGWQAVVRHTSNAALVVMHGFHSVKPQAPSVPLPPGNWRIAAEYGDAEEISIVGQSLLVGSLKPFSGGAILMKNT